MKCGSCDTYLLFLAKKNGECLPSIFLFLRKVGIGGQREKEEDKKRE